MKKYFPSAGFLSTLILVGAVALNSCKDDKSNAAPQEKAAAPAAAAGNKIGVVDVNQVATQLGWDKNLTEQLDKLKKQLSDEYNQIQATYQQQIVQRQREFGIKEGDKPEDVQKKLTPQQQQELGQMFVAGQRILQNLQLAANQEVQAYQGQMLQQYREALMPLVRQVAQDKKLSVVISDPGPLLFHDPDVDITKWVVDAASTNKPQFKPIELPKIQVPPSIMLTAPATTQSTSSPSSTTQPSTGGTGATTTPSSTFRP